MTREREVPEPDLVRRGSISVPRRRRVGIQKQVDEFTGNSLFENF